MGELSYPAPEEFVLADVLHALSDPVRLQIVHQLAAAGGERACGEIASPVCKSTSSHHFKVLREAGVVRARDEGTRRYYTLRREDLATRFPGLLDAVLRSAQDELGALTGACAQSAHQVRKASK